jgi:hypothetical protein
MNDFEGLVTKYFWFLVDDYQFIYENFTYSSDRFQLQIQITADRSLPAIFFRIIGEPDYTTLPFEWILYYLRGSKFGTNFYERSLDENIKFFAELLKEYSKEIFFEVDRWWIPAHRIMLKDWEDTTHKSPVRTFQQLYDYIKEKEGH